jgi:hypothetical protein
VRSLNRTSYVLLFSRNSNTCVRPRKVRQDNFSLLPLCFDPRDNLAAFGKLDGIASQVRDDLPQPRRIAPHKPWRTRPDVQE